MGRKFIIITNGIKYNDLKQMKIENNIFTCKYKNRNYKADIEECVSSFIKIDDEGEIEIINEECELKNRSY